MDSKCRDNGAIAIVVAVFSVAIFGFAAIIVDLGYARTAKARAQDAADSAALAAAAALYEAGSANFGTAVVAAKDNARQVLGRDAGAEWNSAWASCTDSLPLPVDAPGTGCVSFDAVAIDNPRQVRVVVPLTDVDSFFGGVFGYSGIDVSASAVASLGPVTFAPKCAICVLRTGTEEQPHLIAGDTVGTTRADISFNGEVQLGSESTVRAERRTVFLGSTNPDSEARFLDSLVQGAEAVDDPLAATDPEPNPPPPREDPPPPEPPPTSFSACDPRGWVGGPGVYGDVVLGGDPDLGLACVLVPGTYVITGELTAAPGAVITGNNVRLWLRCGDVDNPRDCASGEGGGSIDLSAAASVIMRSPGSTSLVYSRPANVSTIDLFGAAPAVIDGHVNAPRGTVAGGPCGRSTVEGFVVAWSLDVGTNGCLVSTAITSRTTAETMPPVLIR